MPDVWPSFGAYFKLWKAFQGFSRGSARSTGASALSAKDTFRFATAYADGASLSQAVVSCVQQIKARLGCQPDICQVLVAPLRYRDELQRAPAFVQECFTQPGLKQPAVIGGAVNDIFGNRQESYHHQQCGISIFAASLPGVDVFPFHTATSSLPDLPAGAWDQLLTPPGRGVAGYNASALLLAEPHFTSVSDLLQRLHGAVPSLSSIGGVVPKGAWGAHSLRGAVFMGDRVFDSGAVGAFLAGPLQMHSFATRGLKSVGPSLKVTEVGPSGHILALGNQPAARQLFELRRFLSKEQAATVRGFGLDATGSGNAYCMQDVVSIDTTEGSFQLTGPAPPVGSLFGLQAFDPQHAQEELQAQLQLLVSQLPEMATSDNQQLGAMLFSCAGIDHADVTALQAALPSIPFQASKYQGEFGAVTGGTASTVLQYTSSFAVLQQSSLQKVMS